MILDNHEVEVYDNDGETLDRYTVVIDSDLDNCYGMSENALGVNMYVGRVTSEFLDTQKKLKEIPSCIGKAIKQRFED